MRAKGAVLNPRKLTGFSSRSINYAIATELIRNACSPGAVSIAILKASIAELVRASFASPVALFNIINYAVATERACRASPAVTAAG